MIDLNNSLRIGDSCKGMKAENQKQRGDLQTALPCTANLIAARSAGLLCAGNGLGGGVRDEAMSNSPSCIQGSPGTTSGAGGRELCCSGLLPFEGAIFS